MDLCFHVVYPRFWPYHLIVAAKIEAYGIWKLFPIFYRPVWVNPYEISMLFKLRSCCLAPTNMPCSKLLISDVHSQLSTRLDNVNMPKCIKLPKSPSDYAVTCSWIKWLLYFILLFHFKDHTDAFTRQLLNSLSLLMQTQKMYSTYCFHHSSGITEISSFHVRCLKYEMYNIQINSWRINKWR